MVSNFVCAVTFQANLCFGLASGCALINIAETFTMLFAKVLYSSSQRNSQ